jgi:hypothetical protein
MQARTLALFGVFAFACTEYQVHEDNGGIDDLNNDDFPNIIVDPILLDFGGVEVMDEIEHVQVVTVSNDGDDDLEIQNIELQDPGAPFDISAISSVVVPPGNSAQFEVIYDPETAVEDHTYVLIDSNDPDTPVAQVELMGMGIAPVIDVAPTSYDFGTGYVGCENDLPIQISNIGNADLVVEEYSFNTASAEMVFEGIDDSNGSDDGLLTLEPSEMEEVFVTYMPLDEYSDIAYLQVWSNDPFNEMTSSSSPSRAPRTSSSPWTSPAP